MAHIHIYCTNIYDCMDHAYALCQKNEHMLIAVVSHLKCRFDFVFVRHVAWATFSLVECVLYISPSPFFKGFSSHCRLYRFDFFFSFLLRKSAVKITICVNKLIYSSHSHVTNRMHRSVASCVILQNYLKSASNEKIAVAQNFT